MKIFVLLAFAFFEPFSGFACQEDHWNLERLYQNSTNIIYAKVVDTGFTKGEDENYFYGFFAKLVVYESVKGSLKQTELTIEYNLLIACPGWATDFTEDSTVLLFLNRNPSDGSLGITGGFYGVKNDVDSAGLLQYKTRIKEVLEIGKIKDRKTLEREWIDWLFRCIEHEATRWDGIFFLQQHHKYKPLTKSDKIRLSDIFYGPKDLKYLDLMFVDLIKGIDNHRLISFLRKKQFAASDNWRRSEIAEKIAELIDGN